MPNSDANIRDVSGNVNVIQSSGNIYGDIVAGDKTVINNIIQQAAKQIVAAPYKFLNSYDIGDRDIFFGRDAVIEELTGKLLRYKTLVINGRSGAGKTSLINAGLIPRLAENGYHYLSFRDYSDPLRQLREYAAQDDLFRPFVEQAHSIAHFVKTVTSQKNIRLVVIFDQFERFFVNVAAPLRMQFIQEFKACLDSDLSSNVLEVVFALREDYVGAFLIEFEAVIPQFFNQTAHHNLLPLKKEEAREAILRPLRNIPIDLSYNLQFVDEVLLPGLMNQSSGGVAIDPPHLQIVCNQLYETARRRYAADLEQGGAVQIDRALYEQLGATSGILRTYLDDFIDRTVRRDSNSRDVLRSMLKLMLETTGTRKFVSFSDLKTGLPDVPLAAIEQRLRECQDGRIIETRGAGEATRYSLSHEVMAAEVQKWFDERELQRKKAQETLERGIKEWVSNRTLLNVKQLRLIRTWLPDALNQEEKQLIKGSEKRQLTRRILAGGVLFVILAIFGGLFYVLPSRSYYFGVESDNVVLQQGHPHFNLGFLGFPKPVGDISIDYTIDQVQDSQQLTRTFADRSQWERKLIPLLKLPEQGAAYERLGDVEKAINTSVRVIDELPQTLQSEEAREEVALLLIRVNASEELQQKAVATLQVVGRGKALRELTALTKNEQIAATVKSFAAGAKKRIEERIKGNNMVMIPAGEFIMGIPDERATEELAEVYKLWKEAFVNEIHLQTTYIENSFMIDQYEITNQEYVTYLNIVGNHQNEEGNYLLKTQMEDAASRVVKKTDGTYEVIEEKYQQHPVTRVSWYGARAYCEWLGKRLPNEEEWEKSARGEDGRIFPWGDEFDPQRANTLEYWENRQEPDTLPIGTFDQGKSPYSVYDMAGNVWEWTADWLTRYADNQTPGSPADEQLYGNKDLRVTRGGAFDGPSSSARSSSRLPIEIDATDADTGFRCVFDLNQQ